MKQLMEALRSAKRIEILIAAVMLCILVVLGLNNTTNIPAGADGEEARLERILGSIEGAGRVTVMLTRQEEGVLGCVVSTSGANDMHVMLEIQRAVKALTGLELEQIEIVKSKR